MIAAVTLILAASCQCAPTREPPVHELHGYHAHDCDLCHR